MKMKIVLLIIILVNYCNCLHLSGVSLGQNYYPRRVTYINTIDKWWPASKIAEGLAVPSYSQKHIYNYVILAFWTCSWGPLDTVMIWNDPIKYFGNQSQFGNTKQKIQAKLRQLYNQDGVKIMISAFGATQFPTTSGLNAQQCAQKLGDFVLQNNLDGVDIDWEDNPAMQLGKGEEWIVKFTTKLRQLLPKHIISHAPQAPYFKQDYYKNGGYVTINNKVGSLIDFYNVQFYNQGNTKYEQFTTLFLKSDGFFTGTSVSEINKKGVPLNKIVVGKPVTPKDASNTGFVSSKDLGLYTIHAYFLINWYAGIMYWQFSSDKKAESIQAAVGLIKSLCESHRLCI